MGMACFPCANFIVHDVACNTFVALSSRPNDSLQSVVASTEGSRSDSFCALTCPAPHVSFMARVKKEIPMKKAMKKPAATKAKRPLSVMRRPSSKVAKGRAAKKEKESEAPFRLDRMARALRKHDNQRFSYAEVLRSLRHDYEDERDFTTAYKTKGRDGKFLDAKKGLFWDLHDQQLLLSHSLLFLYQPLSMFHCYRVGLSAVTVVHVPF